MASGQDLATVGAMVGSVEKKTKRAEELTVADNLLDLKSRDKTNGRGKESASVQFTCDGWFFRRGWRERRHVGGFAEALLSNLAQQNLVV